ncbi:hypothetical protein F5Y18DRAFT_243802 [Xylariaceae sp. FL1019]|nr:hypothetical protein F5Y18DRAFT_243802 [Xylariaceae sp. FL1019]
MCTEVYMCFDDPCCSHREYQNTFPCHIVRRCHPTDDQLLREPVFLPQPPPRMPPGFKGCKMRRASRPVKGKCRECRRAEYQAMKQRQDGLLATSVSSSNPSTSSYLGQRFITPSPDNRARDRIQDSLFQVAKEQRGTPVSSVGVAGGRQRTGSQGSYLAVNYSNKP